MSRSTLFSGSRKEKSKQKNTADAEISRLALEKIKEDPAGLINTLYTIFIEEKRVTALAYLIKLADGYVLPEPKETGPRRMSLIEKWMSEPQWTPEMEEARKKREAEAAAAKLAEKEAKPDEPETEEAEPKEIEPETEPAVNAVTSEIGITPQTATSTTPGVTSPAPQTNHVSQNKPDTPKLAGFPGPSHLGTGDNTPTNLSFVSGHDW